MARSFDSDRLTSLVDGADVDDAVDVDAGGFDDVGTDRLASLVDGADVDGVGVDVGGVDDAGTGAPVLRLLVCEYSARSVCRGVCCG